MAVFGHNGIGKSTLVKQMYRFHGPDRAGSCGTAPVCAVRQDFMTCELIAAGNIIAVT